MRFRAYTGVIMKTPGKPRELAKTQYTQSEVPNEVWGRFGDFAIQDNNGYLYATVLKQRLPKWFNSERISIAKLVWLCHYPTHRFVSGEKLMYRDQNKLNNDISNLFLGGTK